jgi:hypothetical protein
VPVRTERRYPRYQIQLPLQYSVTAAPAQSGVGWTRTLGEGGACIELDRPLPSKTPIALRLQTDRGVIQTEARIAWTGATGGPGEGTYHGITFVRFAPEQRQILQDVLLPLSMAAHAGQRLPVELRVTCRRKGQTGRSLKGWTGNVNRGGLLVLLPEAVSPGTPLEITIQSNKSKVAVEGEVVWVEPTERRTHGALVKHGLRFTSLDFSVSLVLGVVLTDLR